MTFVPPPMPAGALEELCRALGETATGSQIDRLLVQAHLRDASGESTKWKRIYASIADHQERTGNGRALVAVLHSFMEPGRWTSRADDFDEQRRLVNVNLALIGLTLGADGRVAKLAARARTLDEARERADLLGTELRRRGVHSDVLRFCQVQLLQQNYFHAVLEACKSVAEKVRARTGLTGDGNDLFDRAFSLKHNMPPLAFNRLQDQWEISEHVGLATLIRGVFSTYRNPAAHAPAVLWATDRSEAMDMLTLVSMLHRRLDVAELTPAAPMHPYYAPPPP
jgi:uncharacterized protein (TIGR02391 family)